MGRLSRAAAIPINQRITRVRFIRPTLEIMSKHFSRSESASGDESTALVYAEWYNISKEENVSRSCLARLLSKRFLSERKRAQLGNISLRRGLGGSYASKRKLIFRWNLRFLEIVINPLSRHQLIMIALFHNMPVINDKNPVGPLNRWKPMGNNKGSPPF